MVAFVSLVELVVPDADVDWVGVAAAVVVIVVVFVVVAVAAVVVAVRFWRNHSVQHCITWKSVQRRPRPQCVEQAVQHCMIWKIGRHRPQLLLLLILPR